MPESTGTTQKLESTADAQPAAGERYVINPMISRFTVKAFATGLLSAFGHSPNILIREVSGEAHYDAAAIENSSLHLVVQADSLSVADNVSDKDRREIESQMREQVLEVGKFPKIVYDAPHVALKTPGDSQGDVVLLGQLSLHGVTRAQKVPARITVTGDLLRAFGEFSLRQTDYNIRPISAAAGGLKVKDEVKFTFDIVARKQA